MICSECKKNPAILFYEKIDNGKAQWKAYAMIVQKRKE